MGMANNNSNGELLQTVQPELHPLRWLWWLLAAAILIGAIWGIVAACSYRDPGEVVIDDTPIVNIEPEPTPEVTPVG